MGRVLTNNTGVSYAVESTLGVPDGSGFRVTEPNEISSFGANISTVARSPISPNRQRRKGTVTDLDSAVEFGADITLSSFRDFIEGFCFALGVNSSVTGMALSSVAAGNYVLNTAVTAGQAPKLAADTLLWVSGFATDGNNGLKRIDAGASSTDTDLDVEEALTDETASSTAEASIAGYRFADATAVTWAWSATEKQGTLTSTGIGAIATALGLTPGMLVHFGSVSEIGGSIQNAFDNVGTNDAYGYARVVSVSTDAVVFDKVDSALQIDPLADPGTLDMVFGDFIRNVPVSDSQFLERSFTFEAQLPGLGDGTPGSTTDAYQYARGNFCNTAAFELPLTNKATVTYGFIGTDTDNPTTVREASAATQIQPANTAAFNTTSDIARLRITEADEDGITTDFKSLTITLNNNVSPEKVLGCLGAAFINAGNFEVSIEAQLLFTSPLVVNKIRDNETVTMDFVLKNDDGIIGVDIPSMTLGGGDREFPVNESVLINTTSEAFEDSTLGTSIGISTMPVPLPFVKGS